MDKRFKPFVHGTVAGHTRHRRKGEDPCEDCRKAFSDYSKAYQKKNPDKTKAYAKKTYENIKADPDRYAKRLENAKRYRKPYNNEKSKEYQKWYYENVRKPRMLEKDARD